QPPENQRPQSRPGKNALELQDGVERLTPVSLGQVNGQGDHVQGQRHRAILQNQSAISGPPVLEAEGDVARVIVGGPQLGGRRRAPQGRSKGEEEEANYLQASSPRAGLPHRRTSVDNKQLADK